MRTKQIKESRKLIMNGFFSLLNNKEYSKISMSEIAEASMVTRMTLYRHFKNKDEILKSLIVDLINSIKDKYLEIEKKNLANLIRIRNQEIAKNQYLKIALSNKEAETIIREFLATGRNLLSEKTGFNSKKSKYMREFVLGGIENITTKWILGGLKESPEEITKETLLILQLLDVDMEV